MRANDASNTDRLNTYRNTVILILRKRLNGNDICRLYFKQREVFYKHFFDVKYRELKSTTPDREKNRSLGNRRREISKVSPFFLEEGLQSSDHKTASRRWL